MVSFTVERKVGQPVREFGYVQVTTTVTVDPGEIRESEYREFLDAAVSESAVVMRGPAGDYEEHAVMVKGLGRFWCQVLDESEAFEKRSVIDRALRQFFGGHHVRVVP